MMSQPDIRRYARRTCRSTSDVEDAVQESLWILYRRIGRLQNVGAFSAWIFQIVHRTCLRLAKQHLGLPFEEAGFRTPDGYSWRDLVAPRPLQTGAHLRDVDEMTIGEIVQSLELTRETVKARLHRARALVREYLMR
jgi:DNA-directed RNA polymerase specialized sigma24 family protein